MNAVKKPAVTLNQDQKLYVIACSGGYSCLGFRNCWDHVAHMAQILNEPELAPKEGEFGTLELYERYRSLCPRMANTGTYFAPGTPKKVQQILERYRGGLGRLRLMLGDADTGRDWMEEYDVLGSIGRSMGPLKSPLLIEGRASGGPAILTCCIVRILDVASKRELYKHASYHMPEMQLGEFEGRPAVYTNMDGKGFSTHASFKSHQARANWIAFMKGERMRAH